MPISDAFSPSSALTIAFAAAICAGLLLKFWLTSRQIRHVAQNRSSVPDAFAARISLAAHQKAADYTITKARLSLLEMALGAAVLMGWTLLGGLDALNQALLGALGGGMVQQLALLGLPAGEDPPGCPRAPEADRDRPGAQPAAPHRLQLQGAAGRLNRCPKRPLCTYTAAMLISSPGD